VICEHRELMLSASPSTSGTARQTEKGSRQKNGIILKYDTIIQADLSLSLSHSLSLSGTGDGTHTT
jgi:hypothetical protein